MKELVLAIVRRFHCDYVPGVVWQSRELSGEV